MYKKTHCPCLSPWTGLSNFPTFRLEFLALDFEIKPWLPWK